MCTATKLELCTHGACTYKSTTYYKCTIAYVALDYVTVFLKTDPNRTRAEIRTFYILKHYPDITSTWLKMAKSAFTEGFLPTL